MLHQWASMVDDCLEQVVKPVYPLDMANMHVC